MSSRADRIRIAGWLVLGVCAATRAARLELDRENRSMRSTGTPEARAEEAREARFGREATLVLLVAPTRAERPVPDARAFVAGLRARPEVKAVAEPSGARVGESLLALTLAPDAAGGFGAPLARLLEHVEASTPPDTRVLVSGAPAAEAALAQAMRAEQRRVVPLVCAVLLALLVLLYRSVSLALAAVLPALAGIALTGALQHALGLAIDPVTSLLPPVLLVVGVAAAVHLVEAYLEERRTGAEPAVASRDSIRHVRVPALGCALTTAIGFLALLTSPLPAVRRFGLLAAGGVALTTLAAFGIVPPWLRVFARAPRHAARASGAGRWPRWSSAIAQALERAAPAVVLGALALLLSSGWAWTRLRVDTDPLSILPERHPFRVATAEIGARLGGVETFELMLEPPVPTLAPLRLIELQARLLGLHGVVGPGGAPRSASDGAALCSLLLAPSGTTARERLFDEAEEIGRELGWGEARATGLAVRVARDSGALARGEALGLLASLATLAPCVLLLRSVGLTLVGLAANALPCFLLHGGLALAGRPLSVASAMIGSVILGLIVDDALFFLHGYRAERARAGVRDSVAGALRTRARAMSVTTLVLAAGFLAALAGELETTREFGLLASAAVVAAWGANLFLVPCLLLLGGRLAPSDGAASARRDRA